MEGKAIKSEKNRNGLYLDINGNGCKQNGYAEKHDSFIKHVKRRTEETNHSVANQIGVFAGCALVLQTVIGPGIFTSPKGVAEFSGSIGISYIVWAVSGIFSSLAALCFVELQLSVPRAGCEYGYIHKGFGKLPTFIYTWMRIALAEPSTTAVFCIAFADYVADSIHDKCGPSESNRKLLAIIAVITLTFMNGLLRSLAQGINILSNCGKIVALSIIIGGGVYNIWQGRFKTLNEGFDHSNTSYDSMVMAFYNSLWAYGGWAYVPQVTCGVRRPPRNMPLLILTVIPFVTVIYMLTVTSFYTILSRDELIGAEAIGVGWGEHMYRPFGFIIPIFVCFIAFGNANGTFMNAGRTASVAVHDGYIPEILSYVHVRTQIHIPAIAGRCLATIVLIYFVDVGSLVRFYVFTAWLFHGLTVLALLLLRRRRRSYSRHFEVPLVIPVLVLLFSLAIVIGPFTVWPPRKEFVFSLGVIVLSTISFIPFGKAKVLARYLDWIAIIIQLMMNVVPPKIHKHMLKPITVRQRRSFSPTASTLVKDLSSPGTFTPQPAESISGFAWPTQGNVRQRKRSHSAINRPLQVKSNELSSTDVSNYCDVMNRFDELSDDEWSNNSASDQSNENTSNNVQSEHTQIVSNYHHITHSYSETNQDVIIDVTQL